MFNDHFYYEDTRNDKIYVSEYGKMMTAFLNEDCNKVDYNKRKYDFLAQKEIDQSLFHCYT